MNKIHYRIAKAALLCLFSVICFGSCKDNSAKAEEVAAVESAEKSSELRYALNICGDVTVAGNKIHVDFNSNNTGVNATKEEGLADFNKIMEKKFGESVKYNVHIKGFIEPVRGLHFDIDEDFSNE